MRRPLALMTVLLSACEAMPRTDDGVPVVANDSPGVEGVWEIENHPILHVRGDSGEVADLHRVSSAVRLSDGSIVVGDAVQRVVVYDGEGRHVRTIGRRGSGPGEFQAVAWVRQYSGDSLLVFDPRLMRASVLTADGFVRSFTLARGAGNPVALGAFADGSILAGARAVSDMPPSGFGLLRPDLLLTRHARDGALMDSLGVVRADEIAIIQRVIVRPAFVRRTRVAVGPTRFHVALTDSFAITTYDADGRPVRVIKKPHPLVPVSAAALASNLPAGVELPVPPAYPAMGELLLDDAGNLWAEDPATDVPASGSWFVFNENGRLLGTVQAPERFRPLHVGVDRILGVWQDSSDVEHLRMHRIRKRSRN